MQAILAAMLMVVAGAAIAQTRIGYVDMKRLLDEAPQVDAGRAKLSHEFEDRNQDLKNMEERLEGLEKRLRDESGTLTEEQRVNLEWEIRSLRREINTSRQQLTDDLNIRLNEELDRVSDDVQKAIHEIAEEQGFDLVISSPVEYASKRIDLTDQVLDRLRSRYQGGQANSSGR